MPRFYVEIELRQYDSDGAPKGDELDDALQDALESIDLDCYEVARCVVSRDNPKHQAKRDSETEQQNYDLLVDMAIYCHAGHGNEPSRINAGRSNFDMLAWWVRLWLWQRSSKAATIGPPTDDLI